MPVNEPLAAMHLQTMSSLPLLKALPSPLRQSAETKQVAKRLRSLMKRPLSAHSKRNAWPSQALRQASKQALAILDSLSRKAR